MSDVRAGALPEHLEALRSDDVARVRRRHSTLALTLAFVAVATYAFGRGEGISTLLAAVLGVIAFVLVAGLIRQALAPSPSEFVFLDEPGRRFVLISETEGRRRERALAFDEIASVAIDAETVRESDSYGDIDRRVFTLVARTRDDRRIVLASPVKVSRVDAAEPAPLAALRDRLKALTGLDRS